MKFKRNLKRDSVLVHAAIHGAIVPLAIQVGFTPQDLQDHANWLKKQPEAYINLVAKAVIKIEDGDTII